ncbi:peroxiredoxin [Shewanella yunxiaonensis]|uniref:Glutathione-dependent peroxiredoxin n=1 Tax=Shewanella yunxiaonensis TaxID=2829809 RepID=A0ABX7YUH3_9GAMM|nr:peroxiredoxin [Shewanella yunxiaonensis]QUN05986.1 peroxiredoxin [Shewanella yunxiaonensis]
MITQGQRLPEGKLSELTAEGVVEHQIRELFAKKKVVMFAVPGAFTPTCSNAHLPGFVALADEIKAKGVDLIICLAVNDAFVMKAWGETQNATEIMMAADGDAAFTTALGLHFDTGHFGGIRSRRYAMIVDDGVVTLLNVDEPKVFKVSDARTILAAL